jgi:glutamine---fructose-6-phosphate transaminase (isomerizing)
MTDPRPDPGTPELRAGPPWIMQEMIAAEPGLVAPILGSRASADAVAAEVRAALAADGTITLVGCGTSEHAAAAIGALLGGAVADDTGGRPDGARVVVRQAFEAVMDAIAPGVCIGVSHEGETAATVAALAAARRDGRRTVLITAVPSAPASAEADVVFATPLVDRSWCHTVGYLSPILAGIAVTSAMRPAATGHDARLAATLAGLVEDDDATRRVSTALAGVERIVVAGSGADLVAARELALKIEEGAHIAATARDTETVLHGHLAAFDASTAIVAIVADPRGRDRRAARARQVLRAAGHLGTIRAAIVTPDVSAAWDDELTPAGRLVLPAEEDASEADALAAVVAATAVSLQRLTLAVVHARGTNPDLIRRHETPYRDAASEASGPLPG